MSQIYKAAVSGTPSIPTSFTTDQTDTSTLSFPASVGSAVPQTNILRTAGVNGIQTYQPTNVAGVLEIGFNTGTNTTLGIATATIMTLTPPNNQTTTYQILISGHDATANLGVGGQIIATILKTAGTATVLGTPDIIKNGSDFDPISGITMKASTFTVVAAGATVLVQATSASTNTATWTAITAGQV